MTSSDLHTHPLQVVLASYGRVAPYVVDVTNHKALEGLHGASRAALKAVPAHSYDIEPVEQPGMTVCLEAAASEEYDEVMQAARHIGTDEPEEDSNSGNGQVSSWSIVQ